MQSTISIPSNMLDLIRIEKAKRSMAAFVAYTKSDYQFSWHHNLLCDYLDRFVKGEIKKLMVFMPPQHGKSELVSRKLPSYVLGLNPKKKIVGASYSADLSSSFNRDVQRNIDSEEYYKIFPETRLSGKNVKTSARGSFLRNADIFEIVEYRGFYKSVGVGGSLTGTPADISIIDDPVKDAMEAYSQRIRDNVWEWYNSVLRTRLHNGSQELLTMTRWHEDDLAGRLLKAESDWEVLMLPAIKTDNSNSNDPREIGEALWPKRHSIERLMSAKKLSEKTFSSLYQQNPVPDGGNIIKSEWLEILEQEPYNNEPINFTIDPAYTAKSNNDATAIMAYKILNNDIYVLKVWNERLEFPELIILIKQIASDYGDYRSRIYIEPKASGLSIVQQLAKNTSLNVIEDESPKVDKITRLHSITPALEAGRIKLLKGHWNDMFISQLTSFPAASNDDMVDVLIMAVNKIIQKTGLPPIIW